VEYKHLLRWAAFSTAELDVDRAHPMVKRICWENKAVSWAAAFSTAELDVDRAHPMVERIC
jgi:hypothetical protein